MADQLGRGFPVAADGKLWIEGRTAWLIDQFGWDLLRHSRVILPTEEFFPDPYDGSQAAVVAILGRLCSYMDLNSADFEVRLFSGRRQVSWDSTVVSGEPGALGLYDDSGEKTAIWLEVDGLSDPASVVATLAHELGHARLLGENRINPDCEDHEPLTDLLTVFLGLGVLSANTVVRSSNYHVGLSEFSSISRQGYLTMPLYGYALALFAWLRGEQRPVWSDSLRPDVRKPFQAGLRYLMKTGDSIVTPDAPLPTDMWPSTPADLDIPPSPDDTEEPSQESEIPATTADQYFTRGTLHADAEAFNRAVADFTEAISRRPDDCECYQHRALALYALEQFAEALADAQEAVDLDPDDAESYRARGLVLSAMNRDREAIADFTRVIREEKSQTSDGRRLGEAYYYRGLARFGYGQLRRAISDFTRAIYKLPTWSAIFIARGKAHHQQGKEKRGDADFAQARWLDQDETAGR